MTNFTAQIGVNHVGEIAARNKWMFRPQPIDDIGIDAHMELTEPTGESKQLLALQIKAGPSWFKEQKDECVIFRDINERQYNYWTKNSLPCIVVLYNPEDDMCIWQKLTTETIERTNGGIGKGFFVKVPIKQVFLTEQSNEKLVSFTNLPQHITNYAWLYENGFNLDAPNPTNEVVAPYYGVKPLWKTPYSQGIVVMAEGDSDYYIVMECSSKNKGYKHAMIILTMGGCL